MIYEMYMLQKISERQKKHVIPVLHINRRDYGLKTEIVHLFKELNIMQEDLIFKDELLKETNFKTRRNFKITLVDHNELTGEFADLEDKVVGVIDHRVRTRPENNRYNAIIKIICFKTPSYRSQVLCKNNVNQL